MPFTCRWGCSRRVRISELSRANHRVAEVRKPSRVRLLAKPKRRDRVHVHYTCILTPTYTLYYRTWSPARWNGLASGARPSAYFPEQGPRLSIVPANCHPVVTIRSTRRGGIHPLPESSPFLPNDRTEPGSMVTSSNANTTFDIPYFCETKISRKPSGSPLVLCSKESSFVA